MLWRFLKQSQLFHGAVMTALLAVILAAVFAVHARLAVDPLLGHGAQTTATMVSSDTYQDSDSDTRYRLLVAFTDNAGRRQQRCIDDLNADDILTVGSPITIIYDPVTWEPAIDTIGLQRAGEAGPLERDAPA